MIQTFFLARLLVDGSVLPTKGLANDYFVVGEVRVRVGVSLIPCCRRSGLITSISPSPLMENMTTSVTWQETLILKGVPNSFKTRLHIENSGVTRIETSITTTVLLPENGNN